MKKELNTIIQLLFELYNVIPDQEASFSRDPCIGFMSWLTSRMPRNSPLLSRTAKYLISTYLSPIPIQKSS